MDKFMKFFGELASKVQSNESRNDSKTIDIPLQDLAIGNREINGDKTHAKCPIGLDNLGNTCYFNSTVQALCYTRSFFEELENICAPREIIGSLRCLYRKMLSAQSEDNSSKNKGLLDRICNIVTPDRFKAINSEEFYMEFCEKVPRFGNGRQHDAHEFLRHLLDEVRKEERSSPLLEENSTDNRDNRLTAVDKVFGGHLLTIYICQQCLTPYHIFEPCLDLSLPICINSTSCHDGTLATTPSEEKRIEEKYNKEKENGENGAKEEGDENLLGANYCAANYDEPAIIILDDNIKHKLKRSQVDAGELIIPQEKLNEHESISCKEDAPTTHMFSMTHKDKKVNQLETENDQPLLKEISNENEGRRDKDKENKLGENGLPGETEHDKNECISLVKEEGAEWKTALDESEIEHFYHEVTEETSKSPEENLTSSNEVIESDVNRNERQEQRFTSQKTVKANDSRLISRPNDRNAETEGAYSHTGKGYRAGKCGPDKEQLQRTLSVEEIASLDPSVFGYSNVTAEGVPEGEKKSCEQIAHPETNCGLIANESAENIECTLNECTLSAVKSEEMNERNELKHERIDLGNQKNKVDARERELVIKDEREGECVKVVDEKQSVSVDMNREENKNEFRSSCDNDQKREILSRTREAASKSQHGETQFREIETAAEGQANQNRSAISEQICMVEDDNEKTKPEKIMNEAEAEVLEQEKEKGGDGHEAKRLGMKKVAEQDKRRSVENEQISRSNDDTVVGTDERSGEIEERELNRIEEAGDKTLSKHEATAIGGTGEEKTDCTDKGKLENAKRSEVDSTYENKAIQNVETEKYMTTNTVKRKTNMPKVNESNELEFERTGESTQMLPVEQKDISAEKFDSYRRAADRLKKCLNSSCKTKDNPLSIEDCLAYYTREEDIDSEYLCNNCQVGTNQIQPKLTSAKKQTLIIDPPAVLTLHLKRFKLEPGRFTKVSSKVKYNELLDIGPFCSIKCFRNDKKFENIFYHLYAVVVHKGTLSWGHYKSYIKVTHERGLSENLKSLLQEKYFNCHVSVEEFVHMAPENNEDPLTKGKPPPCEGQWFCLNDSVTRKVEREEVLNQEAYLLFYERLRIGKEPSFESIEPKLN